MDNGQNQRAQYFLLRASADADLAMALAQQNHARSEAQETRDQIRSLKGSP
jgi:hypothetical protein